MNDAILESGCSEDVGNCKLQTNRPLQTPSKAKKLWKVAKKDSVFLRMPRFQLFELYYLIEVALLL